MIIRERVIEKRCCKHAENRGWLVYKFTSPGNNGVPDRIFMRSTIVFLVEFKSEAGELSTLQIAQIKRIQSKAVSVYVISSFDEFVEALDYQESRNPYEYL